MLASRVASRWLQGDSLHWTRMSGAGWKYVDAEIFAWVTPVDSTEMVRDPVVPEYYELTADGEAYHDMPEEKAKFDRMYDQWVRQGWWPRHVPAKKWELRIIYRPRRINFEAVFDTEREALRKGEEAIPKVKMQRRPPWLQVIRD